MPQEDIKPKVCFILTHVPDPRMNKRIDAFKQKMQTEVICTRRASQNIWEPEHHDVKHTVLDIDLPKASQLVKRIKVSKGFRIQLYELLVKAKPTIVYAEGLDTLMVAAKYKKEYGGRVIFEVADLRESFIEPPKGLMQKTLIDVMKHQEKRLFKSVDKLVITSPKFYELHYKHLICSGNVLYIPNIPGIDAFKDYKKKQDGPFTVGFIGGIRYLKQMKMLVDSARDLNINVIFAGAGGTSDEYVQITKYCEDMSNIQFTGRYDYKKDIARLYGMVDCLYSVYDADNANVRIALPNKLYEAVYCELPIIVSKGTYLEEIVKEWGVGVSVGHTNISELKGELKKLRDDTKYYESCVEECRKKRSYLIEERSRDIIDMLGV